MRNYIYKCQNCGNTFEALVGSSIEKVACPKCQSKMIQKKYPFQTTKRCGSG